MYISNIIIESKMKNRRIVKETAIKLIARVEIVDSPLSCYLVGYSDTTLINAVSKWLIDFWLIETIEVQDQFLNELVDELKQLLTSNAHKLEMPWLIGS
ncbi:hypothetical protein [Marinicellulosiphila megalodicopiae]|uniref:hypothetical protein n=1 Tax=Marinicellulosiphila megalodicopiae TaxID=2724896 RepID=UPI003BAE9AFD